eukprot:5487823-Pyramimonas_sp.AAC.1
MFAGPTNAPAALLGEEASTAVSSSAQHSLPLTVRRPGSPDSNAILENMTREHRTQKTAKVGKTRELAF